MNYASVSGTVSDQTGATVEGASVTARQIETNQSTTLRTGKDGRFRFPYLRVGRYEVRVHHDGFADFNRTLMLSIGSAYDLPVTLAIGATESNVTVESDAAVMELARSQIAGTVSPEEVRTLPLNGRNFLDLALLIPGVSPTNTGSNQLFAETSAVPGQGLSVGSQRNFSNNFVVDGLSGNDDAAGLSGIFYSLDVVREFQVVTSGAQAEFGRALGGYISMVTKSGTNTLHGDVYGYFRNQRFNAANPLSHTTLPSTQAQYGASLGGPVIKDRAFYFGNLERRELNQSGLITIAPGNVSAINTRLTGIGYSGPQISTGLYPSPVHNINFLAKADYELSPRDQLSVRYSLYDVTSKNSRGAGALSAVSASAGLNDTDQTVAVANIATLSPNTVNETRGQFTRSNLSAQPTDPIGPAVSISGIASFGRLSTSPIGRNNDLYQIADSVSHQAGPHAFRAGVEFLYNSDAIHFPRTVRGSYSFASIANFLQGIYTNAGYAQTFGNSVVPQGNPNAGFYAQDEWKVNSRLTLNLGVRYDLQFLKTIHTDTDNISPRAGFAWSPWASRRAVVRGGYGLFYDRVPLRALANALLSSANTTNVTPQTQISVNLSPAQIGAPVFPNILTSIPVGVLPNFTTMSRDMQNAYSEQGSLEIEQQIGSKGTLTVGYEHLRGLHLIASVNQNVPTCKASGTNNGCRPNPAYGNNSRYSSLADSHYDDLHVSFMQRPFGWGSYRVSYTYSKALDNVGEFFFSSPINNFNIWQDYGRSDDDQRHRLVFSGTANSPTSRANTFWEHLTHGFELSGILQYYSAFPLNITSGSNTIQGTTARPTINGAFIRRNTGTGNDLFSINARLSRWVSITERLKIQALVEAFNTLNHRNNLTLNGNFGGGIYPSNPLPSFGQVTAVNDPRSLQFALRMRF